MSVKNRYYFSFIVFFLSLSLLLGVARAYYLIKEFRAADWDPTILMLFEPEKRQDEPTMLEAPMPITDKAFETELDHVRVLVKARTKAQEEEFNALKKDPLEHLFKKIGFGEEEFIETKLLFYNALYSLNKKVWEEKWRYQRPRPTQLDPTIESLTALPQSASYPAERAAQAQMIALILTDIMPDFEDEWFAWADQVGTLYEVAGLQFRSDTKAGQKLATKYYNLFQSDLNYQNSILNAQIELINFTPKIGAQDSDDEEGETLMPDEADLPASFP